MYLYGIMLGMLFLGGCHQEPHALNMAALPAERPVAAYYQINTVLGRAPCLRSPSLNGKVLTRLANEQVVVLFDIREGMLERDGEYWLHVVPFLSPRPGCYINTRYLIPMPMLG